MVDTIYVALKPCFAVSTFKSFPVVSRGPFHVRDLSEKVTLTFDIYLKTGDEPELRRVDLRLRSRSRPCGWGGILADNIISSDVSTLIRCSCMLNGWRRLQTNVHYWSTFAACRMHRAICGNRRRNRIARPLSRRRTDIRTKASALSTNQSTYLFQASCLI